MITVTQGSNYWIANRSTEPYAIAVYTDGTAIRAEDGRQHTPSQLPEMTIGWIDPCLLAETVAEIVELAGADLGDPSITDQGTTTVALSATGDRWRGAAHLRYALGVGDEYVEPAQLDARERLSATITTLLDGMTRASGRGRLRRCESRLWASRGRSGRPSAGVDLAARQRAVGDRGGAGDTRRLWGADRSGCGRSASSARRSANRDHVDRRQAEAGAGDRCSRAGPACLPAAVMIRRPNGKIPGPL